MKTASWIKENVEAIAIAVIMALVIRQFAIEAFKIPTGSMTPTLLGDAVDHPGDRILVDKIGPLFSEPDRFEIIVFKFPLNEAKNYIKRLIGFGGETIEIRDGDIFVDGEVARKPPHVQDVLFFEVYPGTGNEKYRSRQTGLQWIPVPSQEPLKRVGENGFRLSSRSGEHLAKYAKTVMDDAPWARGIRAEYPVGDVKVAFAVTPGESSGGEVVVRITDNKVMNELRLAVGEGSSWFRHGDGERQELPGVVLEPGEEVDVSFANVDDALYVDVDGDEFELTYPSRRAIDHGDDGIVFGVKDGEAVFEEIRLYRDLYYVGYRETYRIPEDHYFVLGDNSRSSKDSRVWKFKVFEMKDGTRYYYDPDDKDEESREREDLRNRTVTFQDRDGIMRTLKKADIRLENVEHERWRFVPKENLIGRAFFVFWPINPFNGNFRLKFIR